MGFFRFIRNLDKYLGSAILFLMDIVVVVQVVLRSFFDIPLIGAIEWAQYFLIVVVFISASYATRDGEHIRMAELQKMLPEKVQFVIEFGTRLAGALCFAIVSYSAVISTIKNFRNVTPLGMPIPVFFLPTIVGFALLSLEYFIETVQMIAGKDRSIGL
ncbi:MAG: TRAP transporter small permease [Firmicutes bacterium]|nr:TRAP transporter small permease [Bacillota bacterium]